MNTIVKQLACSVATLLFGRDKEGNAEKRSMPYTISNWPQDLASALELFEGPEAFLERFLKYEDAHNCKGSARRAYGAIVARYEDAAKNWPTGFGPDTLETVLEWRAEDPETREKHQTVNLFAPKAGAIAEQILPVLSKALIAEIEAEIGSEGPSTSFGASFTMGDKLTEAATKIANSMVTADKAKWAALRAGMEKRGYVRFGRLYPEDPTEADEKLIVEIGRWLVYREKWEEAQKAKDESVLLDSIM